MNDQNNIQDELRSLNSSLPVNNSLYPFSVPEGYFDGLSERILAHVKKQNTSAADELQALSPLLAGLSKEMPYSVPDGYFERNAAQPPYFLTEEESPVLAAIGKTLPYTVPQGYFEKVPQQIMARLVRPKAKVVPFFSRTWAKVAVAATIAGIVFIGGYRLLNNKPETVQAATALQPADTTKNLAAANGSSVSQEIQNVSVEELNEFMNTLPVNHARLQRATLAPSEKKEIKEWLKEVPEKEIDAFLDALPTADENLFVID